jgi:hypothetical protein
MAFASGPKSVAGEDREQCGWGGWIKGFASGTFGQESGSTVFVFALP